MNSKYNREVDFDSLWKIRLKSLPRLKDSFCCRWQLATTNLALLEWCLILSVCFLATPLESWMHVINSLSKWSQPSHFLRQIELICLFNCTSKYIFLLYYVFKRRANVYSSWMPTFILLIHIFAPLSGIVYVQ